MLVESACHYGHADLTIPDPGPLQPGVDVTPQNSKFWNVTKIH
jgi:hypothetical protein